MAGIDPDHAMCNLFAANANGTSPAMHVCDQIMPEAAAASHRFDPFDLTKVWPHRDYPLIEVGEMVLNRDNYFAEVESSAQHGSGSGLFADPHRIWFRAHDEHTPSVESTSRTVA